MSWGHNILNIYKMAPLYQQTLWKNGAKKALTEHNKKKNKHLSLPNLIGIRTGIECYGQMRPNFMNSTKYQEILAENMVAFARKLSLGRR